MVASAQNPTPDIPVRRTRTAREAFAVLGIPPSTGYALIAEGKFPCPVIRAGKRVYVPQAALERLLNPDIEAV